MLLSHNNFDIAGGAEVFYHEVGRVLKAQGHQVAYLSAMNNAIETEWRSYFPSVAAYSTGGVLAKAINFPRMIYNRRAKESMARLIEDFNPDIIHAFAIYVQLTPAILDAAREAGVPVVLSCNDYKHICPNYKLYHHGRVCEDCKEGSFYRAIINNCCHGSIAYSVASAMEAYAHNWMNIYRKNVHTFLFASEFMAHRTEEFWGKESFRWKMLRNPFDITKNSLRGPLGDYALYFGRLIDEKGVDVLLEAAARFRELPVVIIGEGPDRESLESRAAELGLTNVSFLGPKWGDDLSGWLSCCRFVVVPSRWHENFPYVIFQAFAAGKPVIGSNRGGIPELIDHGARGFVYEASSPEALATAMRKLGNGKDDVVKDMGRRARSYVEEEFNDKRFYERLMGIYEGVLR
ncbi:glycosyltransferase family 4 protein [Desulfolithobacter dissulfuricans]|uniref:glycosyltransferase family 4 protein n=1 Tax=Desulfolithobacter dissulfuricans TaxID=2795293 RepID=UPI00338F7FCC